MIQPISVNTPIYFKNESRNKSVYKPQNIENDSPISRKGEVMKLVTATFIGGLALAGKLLLEVVDNGDFLVDVLAEKAKKAAKESKSSAEKEKVINEAKKEAKKAAKDRKILHTIGAFGALVATFFAGFALLYTAFHAPKIAYESKVNTFKKSKEMDVYVKSNNAEKELYTQLDERAKNSSAEEKAQLKEQYLKLKNAKNQTPDFANVKLK